jgi:hypothetical protein
LLSDCARSCDRPICVRAAGLPPNSTGEASHQSDGLAPTSKRRMQRRSPRPADAELPSSSSACARYHNELFFMVPQYRVNGFHESPFRTERVNSLHRRSAACVGTRPRSPSRRAARWCRSRRLRPRRTYRPRGRPGPCPARRSSRAGRTDPRRRDGVGHFCRRWAARLPWPALPVGRSGERGTPADGGKVLKVIGAPESAGQRPKLLPSQVLPISGGR